MIGQNWYANANMLCKEIAERHSVPMFKVCAVMSALSVNSAWNSNQTTCRHYFATGEVRHFPAVRERMAKIMACTCPVEVIPLFGGLKTRSFYLNLLNPTPSTENPPVTIDRWMLRMLENTEIVTPKRYRSASRKIYKIAKERGLHPVSCQAVLWCEIRGSAA